MFEHIGYVKHPAKLEITRKGVVWAIAGVFLLGYILGSQTTRLYFEKWNWGSWNWQNFNPFEAVPAIVGYGLIPFVCVWLWLYIRAVLEKVAPRRDSNKNAL